MSISERDRHELYLAFEELIGAPVAETMMSMLPPVGWADVATKHDLVGLEDRLERRFDAMEARFDGRLDAMESRFVDKESFQREMRELSHRLTFALVGSQISFVALVVTVLTLTR